MTEEELQQYIDDSWTEVWETNSSVIDEHGQGVWETDLSEEEAYAAYSEQVRAAYSTIEGMDANQLDWAMHHMEMEDRYWRGRHGEAGEGLEHYSSIGPVGNKNAGFDDPS